MLFLYISAWWKRFQATESYCDTSESLNSQNNIDLRGRGEYKSIFIQNIHFFRKIPNIMTPIVDCFQKVKNKFLKIQYAFVENIFFALPQS